MCPLQESRLKDLKNLISKAHEGQYYGDMDYVYHLHWVDMKVREIVGDDNPDIFTYRAVALLHDIIEDTDITITTLENLGLSRDIIDAVIAITHLKHEPRKEYLDRVMDNEFAYQVKIADTLCNLDHSIQNTNFRRIDKYTKQLRYLYLLV